MTRYDNSNDFSPITVYVWHETPKAFLCTTTADQDKDRDGFWLPKSQLRNTERNGNFLNCDIADWLAEEKGIDLDVGSLTE